MSSFENFRGSERWGSSTLWALGREGLGKVRVVTGWLRVAGQKPGGEMTKGRMYQHQVQMTPQRHFSEKEEGSAVTGRGIRATEAFKRPWRSMIL